jgi:hypothetical protein
VDFLGSLAGPYRLTLASVQVVCSKFANWNFVPGNFADFVVFQDCFVLKFGEFVTAERADFALKKF